jgi:hypothetical protein
VRVETQCEKEPEHNSDRIPACQGSSCDAHYAFAAGTGLDLHATPVQPVLNQCSTSGPPVARAGCAAFAKRLLALASRREDAADRSGEVLQFEWLGERRRGAERFGAGAQLAGA